MKVGYSNITLLNIILVVTLSVSVYGSVYNTCYGQASPIYAETPNVILQQGTEGTSTIYTNDTSAKVNVSAQASTYDYVLEVVNKVTVAWRIRLRAYNESNIGRLSNCTIYFHDGDVSSQICIYDGEYSQQYGDWYDLAGSSTVYIAMNVSATSTGTSHVYAYLEILVPNTSVYNLLIITFEIS